jgi:integrase
MASTTLSLKTPNEEKSLIWLTVSDGRDVNLKIYSGITIATKHWSKSKHHVLSANNKAIEINRHLIEFEKKVLGIYLDAKSQGYKISAKEIKQKLQPIIEKEEMSFWGIWNTYLEMKKLIIKKRSSGKIKALETHLRAFEEFQKSEITFEAVNEEFLQEFQAFFYAKRKLNTQSTAKYIIIFKTFLNWSLRKKHINNRDFANFTPINQPESIKVVITADELNKIRALKVGSKKYLENVRQLFILSCKTGLRFSDYSRISKEHLQYKDGVYHLRIRQEKTEQFVDVPLITESLQITRDLISHKIKPISNQNMNKYVKELCELAGLSDLQEVHTYVGKEKKTCVTAKYNLVTTHTGRRTFATDLLLQGVDAGMVMQFTGHKDYKSFSSYVNIPKQTQMNIIRNALIGGIMKIA